MTQVEGLAQLNALLDRASSQLVRDVKSVVKKTAVEVKKDATKRLRAGLTAGGSKGKSRLSPYARSITFDILDAGLSAEIGPDQSMNQGTAGRGVEFGSANHGPIPHMLPAADAQEPKFQSFLEKAMGAVL